MSALTSRVHTRHIHKPGDVFGEYPNQWVACARADMRFDRMDDNAATDMLGAPVCRGVPAVHISGLGMYGEKRGCMRVVEIASCYTTWPGGERKPEYYRGCILRSLSMDDPADPGAWDARYDREPGFPEYVDTDSCITARGIYKGWREHGEPVMGTGDVLSWICAADRESGGLWPERFRDAQFARSVRLVLDEMVGYGVHGTRVGYADGSIGAVLRRVGRWTYTFGWSGNAKEARDFADAACGAAVEGVRQ